MKRIFCLAASSLIVASAFAQTVVTTPVMGFLTLNLTQGTNFMGFALLPSMELQATANIGTDGGGLRKRLLVQGSPSIALTNGQFNVGSQASHTVEIANGDGIGFTSVVVNTLAAGNEIILADALPASVLNGVSIKVWKTWTLGAVFGTDVVGTSTTVGLTANSNPALADIIQIPNGSGFDEYYYSLGGNRGNGWRKVGLGDSDITDQSAVPLKFSTGLAIYARSAKAIILVGQVKPGATKINLATGNNFVTNLCPVQYTGGNSVGLTLDSSGLRNGLTGANAYTKADLVMIWSSVIGGYIPYYYSTGGLAGSGWREVGQGNSPRDNTALPDGAYIIMRRGSPTTIQISQGSF